MSQDTIIKVENLSKTYLLNKHSANKSDTLYGNIAHQLRHIKNIGKKKETELFLALDNISLDIKRGDRVGVIGRNGAGKSTLLKILSRITPPTKGRIEINGKLASLLEVGTGFHGDLSGRENIYLNGSILGMSKQEIERKFDEIVAFSEVEKFLDTPVKRYSSGMYVRLAFAVAAHLDSDILIVDEVLAVGDSVFQKKCLGKMNEISKEGGRTILFVSHNLAAIQNLCNKSMILRQGSLELDITDTSKAVKHYLNDVVNFSQTEIINRKDREGEGLFKFKSITIKDAKDQVLISAQSGIDVVFEFGFELKSPSLNNVTVAMTIYTDEGREMFTLSNEITGLIFEKLQAENKIKCKVKNFPLVKGSYVCNIIAYKDGIMQDYIQEAFLLNVEEGDFYGTGRLITTNQSCFLVENEWMLQ